MPFEPEFVLALHVHLIPELHILFIHFIFKVVVEIVTRDPSGIPLMQHQSIGPEKVGRMQSFQDHATTCIHQSFLSTY